MKSKAISIKKYEVEPIPHVRLSVEMPIYPIDILRAEYFENNISYAKSIIEDRLKPFIDSIKPIMKIDDRKYIGKITTYFSIDLLDRIQIFLEQYLNDQRSNFSNQKDEIQWIKNNTNRRNLKLEIETTIYQLFRPYRMFQAIVINNAYKNDSYDQRIEHKIFEQAIEKEKAFVPTKKNKNLTWDDFLFEACTISSEKLYNKIKRDSIEFDLLIGRFNSYKYKLKIYKS